MNRRVFLKSATAAVTVLPPARGAAPIYLTDLSRCEPQSVLSKQPQPRHWRMLDYETESLGGIMLVAGQNTHAPEISYPLKMNGWHAIHFGLRSYAGQDNTRLQVRLTRDPAFSMITHQPEGRDRLDEYYWQTANLTDQQLVFRQYWTQIVPDDPDSVANPCHGVWLAYIKLVPLTEAEVRAFEEEFRSKRHRRLFAHHDAWSYTYTFRPTTKEEIQRELEPFRHTDFVRIYWEGGMGDRMYYPSKTGLTAADEWIKDPYRVGDRLAGEAWRALRQKGIDPYRTAIEHAHSLSLEFHGTYRPAGFHFPVPEDEWNTGGIYDQHQEWRGRDKQGRPTPRLSYAYPDVRRVALTFLREMAAYPVDGICIAYNRRPPLVEYEPPVVESFRVKYGRDPAQLDDRDPVWLRHRAGVLTQFMRELRAMLNGLRRPLEISAIVMGTEQENLYFGMDLEAWIAAGVVDTIIPYSSGRTLDSGVESWGDAREAEFLLRITNGNKCKLAFNLMPRLAPPESYLRRAHLLYEASADHLFFWDTNARYDFSPAWTTLRRLGHKEEVAAWARAGSPRVERPGGRLIKLGGWDLRYETPG